MTIPSIAVRVTTAFFILVLASCAQKPQVVQTPPAPEQIPPRPTPPVGAYGTIKVPPRTADGRFATINYNLNSNQSIWHLRSALNVAALSCRGSAEQSIVSNYNRFLHQHEKQLASVHRSERQAHNKRGGSRAFDEHMTKVYNFYAQPGAQAAFCAKAEEIVQQVAFAKPQELADFALPAVANLEAPFADFYHRYEQYQAALAAWDSRYGANAAAAGTANTGNAALAATQSAAWRVQLGAYNDNSSANDAWQKVQSRISALNGLQASYEPVPDKKMVRLQAGPLSNKQAADALCATITSTGQGCIPVGPSL